MTKKLIVKVIESCNEGCESYNADEDYCEKCHQYIDRDDNGDLMILDACLLKDCSLSLLSDEEIREIGKEYFNKQEPRTKIQFLKIKLLKAVAQAQLELTKKELEMGA